MTATLDDAVNAFDDETAKTLLLLAVLLLLVLLLLLAMDNFAPTLRLDDDRSCGRESGTETLKTILLVEVE